MFAIDIEQLQRMFTGRGPEDRWTSSHEGHLNRHLANRNAIPHVNTHSKEQAKAWIRKFLAASDLALSIASFTALLMHHGATKEESKHLALKWSGHLKNAQTGVNIFEKVWDILDKQKGN